MSFIKIIHYDYTSKTDIKSTELMKPAPTIESRDAAARSTPRCPMTTLNARSTFTLPHAPVSLKALSARSLWARLRQAQAITRQRRALRDLDDAILRDIGLTRAQALQEGSRPFWDAPRHWRG